MFYTEEQKNDIYRQFYPKVLGYVSNHIRNHASAEDIATDIFLKIYSKLDGFDPAKASLSTWIYTVTRNTLTDFYRTRKVHEEIPETLADDSSVEENILNAEMLDTLAEGLEALEERERDIIVLRYYSGRTLKDIAEQMHISYAYVKILHNKALVELKKFFNDED